MVIMQINSELAKQHGGGHGGLRYCGIELFFKRYFILHPFVNGIR